MSDWESNEARSYLLTSERNQGSLVLGVVVATVGIAAWTAPIILSQDLEGPSKGLAVALWLSLGVGPLLRLALPKEKPKMPPLPEQTGDEPQEPEAPYAGLAPNITGHLEVMLFYGAILSHAWAAIGGWLVFKAASKWAAWQHIVRVPGPDELPTTPYALAWLSYRHEWGSQRFASIVIGTLANIIVAGAGALVGILLANNSFHPTAFGGG